MSRFTALAQVLAVALLATACGTDQPGTNGGTTGPGPVTGKIACISGSSEVDCKAKTELRREDTGKLLAPGDTVIVEVGNIANGAGQDIAFTLSNTIGTVTAAELVIDSIKLDYEIGAPEEAEAEAVAFECWNADGSARCGDVPKWNKVVPGGLEKPEAGRVSQEKFVVRYTRFDSKDRTATLRIKLRNDPQYTSPKEFTVKFQTKQGKPKAAVSPAELVFPYVAANETKTSTFKVTNVGDALLVVHKLDFVADSVFTLTTKDGDKDVIHEAGKSILFDPAIEVVAGGSVEFPVTFKPTDDFKKQGTVTVHSNDPSALEGVKVNLLANSAVPCITLVPKEKVNFGGVLAGANDQRDIVIKNCGGEDLIVKSIGFIDGTTSDEFSFVWDKMKAKFPDMDAKKGPTADNPIVLKLGEEVPFTVDYAPADITKGEPPKPDVGVIEVLSNAFSAKKVTVEGIGVEFTCPLAKVSVKEGEEVIPQTLLHLKGDQSAAPGGGTIKKYKWTVKQPAGSNQPLLPNANFPNPSLMANAAGEYEFCLEVWDQNDQTSCQPACVTVLVVPNNAIHVELLWDTPSDPDQTDNGPAAGADMDLHFAHPLASGPDIDCDGSGDPWFSNPFDTFWFNPNPNWGSSNPSVEDDPSLDLDDTDGAGPENLNLEQPEGEVSNPTYYSIGVHYWNDHGYGTSYASVNIYLMGTQALQLTKIPMDVLDMWYVGKINWPNQLTGANKPIFDLCYQKGDQCLQLSDPTNPKAGKMWQPSGDWCVTHCYENKSFTASAGGAAPAKCKALKP